MYPMSRSSARRRAYIYVCVDAYACVCEDGNRWSDAAKILGTIPKRFLRSPIFAAKNDYTGGGEISASLVASKLIFNYRLSRPSNLLPEIKKNWISEFCALICVK